MASVSPEAKAAPAIVDSLNSLPPGDDAMRRHLDL